MRDAKEQWEKLKTQGGRLAKTGREKAAAFLQLAAANKKVSVPAAAAVVVIVLALAAAGGSRVRQEAAQPMLESENTDGAIPVPDLPLEEDAYPEINALMQRFYEAMGAGDLDAIRKLKSYVSEEEAVRIQKKQEYIEDYPEVRCYTKAGPIEDSFIVYAYHEARLKGYEDILVPAISSFYVCRNEEGNYWIFDGAVDQNVEEYFRAVSAQDDVKALFDSANVRYEEIIGENAELSNLLLELRADLHTSIAEEMARQVVEENGEDQAQEEQPEETQPEETQPQTQTEQIVAATDVVNIRSSDSETADRLGKAEIGQQFTLLESRGNGWSKVAYEGGEAYIKSEYLTAVEAEGGGAAQTQEPQTQEKPMQEEPAQQETQTSSGGTVMAKESVNVRKSASETAERLGTVYQGEKLELIQKQADGWTKVKYQGQTGYVKSEYVE